MNRAAVFCGRNLKEILRDPMSVLFGLGFPVVILLLLTIINNSNRNQQQNNYSRPSRNINYTPTYSSPSRSNFGGGFGGGGSFGGGSRGGGRSFGGRR